MEKESVTDQIRKLSKLLLKSHYTVVLTGAGMDTESNIPDFRGQNGLWRDIDPRVVADIRTFRRNYKLFHEFYTERLARMAGVMPHPGHYILADLEKTGLIHCIATQNISGLHAKAGSKNIYELHGNMKSIFCNECKESATESDLIAMKACSVCGEQALRPGVVLFGETLPDNTWSAAANAIKKSDLLIVVGTSLEVSPVNQLPYLAQGKQVLINNEDRSAGYDFDLVILGQIKVVLESLINVLNEEQRAGATKE